MAQHVHEPASKLLSNVIIPVSMVVTALKINFYMMENVFRRRNVHVTLTVKNTSRVKLFKRSVIPVYAKLEHGLAQKRSAKPSVK